MAAEPRAGLKDMALEVSRPALSLTLALLATACSKSQKPAEQAAVVDSALARDEALRRFRTGLAEVTELGQEAPRNRDQLVSQFVKALETRDTAMLRDLVLTKAEFAYLYYPTNPQSLPPYDLSPALMWFMTDQNSNRGLLTALAERGGQKLKFAGYECLGAPSRQGENTVWGPCVIRRVQAPGDTVSERLFGPIIERNGRFK